MPPPPRKRTPMSTSAPEVLFDRALLRERRRRVQAEAERYDFLLRRVAEDLAERLTIIRREFPRVLVMPGASPVLGETLRGVPSLGLQIAADLVAPPAGTGTNGLHVVADEEALPFAHGELDAAVCALGLQLVNDLPGALVQLRRALKPDGLLLAAVLGGATLKELRESWLVAEDEICGGASPRVAPFADVRDMGALAQRAGFALPVVDSETLTVAYGSALDLMRDIKGMGASNMLAARRRVPVTRRLLLRAAEIYAERFSRGDGRVTATFEIITLTAWVPHESQPKALAPGSATVRLADVLGTPKSETGGSAPTR